MKRDPYPMLARSAEKYAEEFEFASEFEAAGIMLRVKRLLTSRDPAPCRGFLWAASDGAALVKTALLCQKFADIIDRETQAVA